MTVTFRNVFKTGVKDRDNFIARLFGLISEEPIRLWARHSTSPYEYVGRPSLWSRDKGQRFTLDFLLRRRSDGLLFVSEMKCELAYQGYKYLALESCEPINRHAKEKAAFRAFLEMAKDPASYDVTVSVRSRPERVSVSGAILIWGSITEPGKQATMSAFGFADVLSVEEAIADLLRETNEPYSAFISQRRQWCDDLFCSLLDKNAATEKRSP